MALITSIPGTFHGVAVMRHLRRSVILSIEVPLVYLEHLVVTGVARDFGSLSRPPSVIPPIHSCLSGGQYIHLSLSPFNHL